MSTPTVASSPAPGLIEAQQLARLTGLSERRLRQLAQFGAIPTAKRNRYPLAETLQGILSYYRRQDEERTVHDEYPSLKACSDAVGIPIAMLKEAKREGCPAFRDGKVRLLPFLRWSNRHQEDTPGQLEDLQTLKLKLQNAKLEFLLMLKRDEMLPEFAVRKLGANLGHNVRRAVLRLHLLAPSLVGLPINEVESLLLEAERDICSLVDDGLDLEKVWTQLEEEAERV